MDFSDDDMDFNFDDLSPEEKEEFEKEQREKDKKIKTHPLFLKATDIYKTVEALIHSLPEDEQDMYASTLAESSMMLAPKIAGAIGSESWLLCMQNAAIIRYHAEYLHTSTSGLKMYTSAQKDYVQILRSEMEEFRELFASWVKTFAKLDKEEYTDEWGLFLR
jgi:hypothetical protein